MDLNSEAANLYTIDEKTVRSVLRGRPTSLEEFMSSRGEMPPLPSVPPQPQFKPVETRGKTGITNADISKLESERNSIIVDTTAKLKPAIKVSEVTIENAKTYEQLLEERRAISTKPMFPTVNVIPHPQNPREIPTSTAPPLTPLPKPRNPYMDITTPANKKK
jgi:hypothetical protein